MNLPFKIGLKVTSPRIPYNFGENFEWLDTLYFRTGRVVINIQYIAKHEQGAFRGGEGHSCVCYIKLRSRVVLSRV